MSRPRTESQSGFSDMLILEFDLSLISFAFSRESQRIRDFRHAMIYPDSGCVLGPEGVSLAGCEVLGIPGCQHFGCVSRRTGQRCCHLFYGADCLAGIPVARCLIGIANIKLGPKLRKPGGADEGVWSSDPDDELLFWAETVQDIAAVRRHQVTASVPGVGRLCSLRFGFMTHSVDSLITLRSILEHRSNPSADHAAQRDALCFAERMKGTSWPEIKGIANMAVLQNGWQKCLPWESAQAAKAAALRHAARIGEELPRKSPRADKTKKTNG